MFVVATLAAVALAAAGPAASGPEPRCFGAAARDPEHACVNPKLRYMVRPTPSQAEITPNAPCTEIEPAGMVRPCAFGVKADEARRTVALVGDSHALHWRAAVDVVAQRKRWRVLSIARSGCAFSMAIKNLPTPAAQAQCTQWNREVRGWLAAHPEVTMVLAGQTTSRKGVAVMPGHDVFDAEVRGYIRAWSALPASVAQVLVLRDNPHMRDDTLACVSRAMARHDRAGPACARLRRRALRRDPAGVAAARMRSDRVRVVDLTPFFCDHWWCYPVVGGALVYKDAHHLTRVFSATLGPFLLRAVNRLSSDSADTRAAAG